MEYVGEIITSDEAARRETNYADRGLFYLTISMAKSRNTRKRNSLDPTVFENAAAVQPLVRSERDDAGGP